MHCTRTRTRASRAVTMQARATCAVLSLRKHEGAGSSGDGPKPARRLILGVQDTPLQGESMAAKPKDWAADAHGEGGEDRYVSISSRSMNNIAPRVLQASLSMEAKKKIVHERLKQAERLVAEGHWLDSVLAEMRIYTKDDAYFIGNKLYSMRQTALESLAAIVSPDYEDLRSEIADHLWADYLVLDDSASFLTGLVHWAKHSVGAVTVADVLLPGAPLIYVNDKFAEMSGFARSDVLGRNCRFMQGPETEPELVASMKASIALGKDCHVKITNYRKNGSTFVNLVSLRPVKDSCGVFRFVIGLHSEIVVTKNPERRESADLAPNLDDTITPPLLRHDQADPDPMITATASDPQLDMASLQKVGWHQRVFQHLPLVMLVVVRQNAEPAGAVLAHTIAKYNKLFPEDEGDDSYDANKERADQSAAVSMALVGQVSTAHLISIVSPQVSSLCRHKHEHISLYMRAHMAPR